MTMPFNYLLILWVTNYAHNRGWLTLTGKKTAQVLYPTTQDEPSLGFSQGHFHHTISQKHSPI